jgi:hypothetical protein
MGILPTPPAGTGERSTWIDKTKKEKGEAVQSGLSRALPAFYSATADAVTVTATMVNSRDAESANKALKGFNPSGNPLEATARMIEALKGSPDQNIQTYLRNADSENGGPAVPQGDVKVGE